MNTRSTAVAQAIIRLIAATHEWDVVYLSQAAGLVEEDSQALQYAQDAVLEQARLLLTAGTGQRSRRRRRTG